MVSVPQEIEARLPSNSSGLGEGIARTRHSRAERSRPRPSPSRDRACGYYFQVCVEILFSPSPSKLVAAHRFSRLSLPKLSKHAGRSAASSLLNAQGVKFLVGPMARREGRNGVFAITSCTTKQEGHNEGGIARQSEGECCLLVTLWGRVPES